MSILEALNVKAQEAGFGGEVVKRRSGYWLVGVPALDEDGRVFLGQSQKEAEWALDLYKLLKEEADYRIKGEESYGEYDTPADPDAVEREYQEWYERQTA